MINIGEVSQYNNGLWEVVKLTEYSVSLVPKGDPNPHIITLPIYDYLLEAVLFTSNKYLFS